MKLIACVISYNDEWVIGLSARALLRYCDGLVVGLHRSTDRTAAILADVAAEAGPARVTVVEQDELYPRTSLPVEQVGGTLRRDHIGRIAIEQGATHVLVIDTDEVLTGNLVAGARAMAEANRIVYLPWIQVWDQPDAYRTSWNQPLPFLFEVSRKSHWISSAHGRFPADVAAAPYPSAPHVAYGTGGVMHLQFLSRRRLAWKRLMYRLGERMIYPERAPQVIDHKFADGIVPPRADELAPMPAEWWAGLEDLRPHLHPEMPPWHEAECHRIVQERGREILDGLDLGDLSW